MATQVASLFGTLDLVDNFTPGLHVALGGVDNFTGRLGQAGTQLTAFGVGLGAIVGPVAAGFSLATGQALGFTEQMADIQSITHQNDAEIAALGNTLLDLDNKFTGQQTAAAFYDIVGSVADASTHMAILDASIETAIAGNADLDSTTSALTATMNSYNFSADKAGFVSDVLTRTVGMGVGKMNEFAAALPNVTGLADDLGIQFDQLGGMTAFLTTKGNTASEAVTQLGAIMNAFMKPNEAMKKGLAQLGLTSGMAAIEQLGLVGALTAVANGGIAQSEGLAALLGTQEALRGSVALMGSDYEGFINTFITGVDGATASAYAFQTSNPAYEFQRLKAEIIDTGTSIGIALLPQFNSLLGVIAPILKFTRSWIVENPKLVSTLATITFGLAGLAAAATFGGMALTAIGGAAAILISPLGLLIGLVAVFGAAFSANFLGIRDAAQPVIAVLGLLANGFGKTFELLLTGENAFDALRNGLGFFVDDMARAVGISEKQARGIQRAFMNVTRFIQKGDWAGLGKMVSQGMADLLPAVNEGWAKLRESAPAAMEALGGVVADATDWLVGKMASFGELIAENGPRILSGFVLLSAMVSGWIINTAIPELTGLAWSMASSFAVGFVNGITNNEIGLGGFTASILSAIEALPSQAAGAVSGFGPAVLQSMSSGIGDAGEWALMSVVIPVVGALTNPTNWALAAAAGGVLLYQMGAMNFDGWLWATTHIITPIVLALTSAENWAWAGGVLGVIVGAMGVMALDATAWTMAHLISPIVMALTTPENWAWAAGTLGTIFTALAAGTGNAANFVTTKIIDPIKNAISAQANTIYNAIASMINDAIPDSISLLIPSVDLGFGATIGGGNFTLGPIPNPIAMRAMGGPVMAGRPYLVGEKGPELMVPSSSGEIVPNHELGRGGGRGAITIYGDVSFYGVNDIEGMYDQLEEVKANRGN